MFTVLCIDDEEIGLKSISEVLESRGYKVIAVRTAEDGIRIFSSHNVDAVVLDYWIGPTRGLSLAKEFRQLRPGVPIIMLSGYASLPNEIDGVADGWIIKGGRTENLLQTLDSLLR